MANICDAGLAISGLLAHWVVHEVVALTNGCPCRLQSHTRLEFQRKATPRSHRGVCAKGYDGQKAAESMRLGEFGHAPLFYIASA